MSCNDAPFVIIAIMRGSSPTNAPEAWSNIAMKALVNQKSLIISTLLPDLEAPLLLALNVNRRRSESPMSIWDSAFRSYTAESLDFTPKTPYSVVMNAKAVKKSTDRRQTSIYVNSPEREELLKRTQAHFSNERSLSDAVFAALYEREEFAASGKLMQSFVARLEDTLRWFFLTVSQMEDERERFIAYDLIIKQEECFLRRLLAKHSEELFAQSIPEDFRKVLEADFGPNSGEIIQVLREADSDQDERWRFIAWAYMHLLEERGEMKVSSEELEARKASTRPIEGAPKANKE